MCSIDWGLVAEVIGALAGVATVVLAALALQAWKQQLHGTNKISTANDILVAAASARYAFYGARSRVFQAWEFPESYRTRAIGQQPSNAEKAQEYLHAYQGRLKSLWPYLRDLLALRARAGVVFDQKIVTAIEDVVAKANELRSYTEEHVEQLRVGPAIVAQWTDQAFARRARESVTAGPDKADVFSSEFETAYDVLRKLMEAERAS
jgi:hypothetical protein